MKYLKILLSLFVSSLCLAQTKNVLPTYSSLSNNSINCIAEDKDGYIWIGTNRGLNRYNGTNYKIYEEGEEYGLLNNNILSLCADRDGTVWIGTSMGLNAITGDIIRSDVKIKEGSIYSIKCIDDNSLVFSARNKVFFLNKNTLKYRTIYEDDRITYNSLTVSKDGHIWINHLVLPVLTILNSKYEKVSEVSLIGRIITGVTTNSDGTIIVLTDKGIYHYSSDGKQLKLDPNIDNFVHNKHIVFYHENRREPECVTLGINNQGIFKINLHSGLISQLWDKERLANTYSAEYLVSSYGLWLSENGWGLKLLSLRNSTATITVPTVSYPTEALNTTYALNDSTLLILTNKNIYHHDLQAHRSTQIRADELSGNEQLSISTINKDGHLWIVVNGKKLREYNFDGRKYDLLSEYDINYTVSIWSQANGVIQLLQDNRIVSYHPNGLITTQFLRTSPPPIWYCGQSKYGTPYMIGMSGVYKYDAVLGNIERINVEVPYPAAVYEDEDGILWIGSRENGVYRYDPYDKSVYNFGKQQGLSELSVRSIEGDTFGNIWIATSTQVACISKSDRHITLYNTPAMMYNQFSTNSSLSLSNGHILFGSIDLIVDYYSLQTDPEEMFEIELDGVLINGSNLVPIPKKLELDRHSNQISFFYSIKNFSPDIIAQYEYKLEGYDTQWVAAGQNFRAAYSSLSPGHYSFWVRSPLPSGKYLEKCLISEIRIKPNPFWSLTSIIIYIILAIGISIILVNQYIKARIARKNLELAKQEKMLTKQITEEKINFFSNVSHEFRTPLSLIYGPIKELSGRSGFDEYDKELIDIVLSNSERLIKLSDQLLSFNKEDSLNNLLVMKTNVIDLVNKLCENFSYLLNQKGMKMDIIAPEDTIAYCDKEKLERILFNLISNAIKYNSSGCTITIRIKIMPNNIMSISVEDTGVGISEDKVSKLFMRFERLGREIDKNPASGFGIGLNYSQYLAHLHKGQIVYTPNAPQGSVFTFTFPLNVEAYDNVWKEDVTKTSEPVVQEEEEKDGFSILIAEDNADMQEYLRRILGKYYNLTITSDGEEALKCLKMSIPDLVVSDVIMPYKDGFTLCKDIKGNLEYCHIPVILLTAKADMESNILGLDMGADAYITKPFESSHLLSSIRNLIQNRQRVQHLLSEANVQALEEVSNEDIRPKDKAFLEKMYKIINAHLADEEFGVSALAAEIGMSRTSVFSKIKTLLGESPQGFITNYRLNKAIELLKTHEMNISEVAYSVGFSTLTGFSRSFKNKFGVPPSTI